MSPGSWFLVLKVLLPSTWDLLFFWSLRTFFLFGFSVTCTFLFISTHNSPPAYSSLLQIIDSNSILERGERRCWSSIALYWSTSDLDLCGIWCLVDAHLHLGWNIGCLFLYFVSCIFSGRWMHLCTWDEVFGCLIQSYKILYHTLCQIFVIFCNTPCVKYL